MRCVMLFESFLIAFNALKIFFFYKEIKKWKQEFSIWRAGVAVDSSRKEQVATQETIEKKSEHDTRSFQSNVDKAKNKSNYGHSHDSLTEKEYDWKKFSHRILDIFEVYFSNRSPYQLSLPEEILEPVQRYIQQLKTLSAQIDSFDPAEANKQQTTNAQEIAAELIRLLKKDGWTIFDESFKAVFCFLRDDCLPKFLESGYYENYRRIVEKNKKLKNARSQQEKLKEKIRERESEEENQKSDVCSNTGNIMAGETATSKFFKKLAFMGKKIAMPKEMPHNAKDELMDSNQLQIAPPKQTLTEQENETMKALIEYCVARLTQSSKSSNVSAKGDACGSLSTNLGEGQSKVATEIRNCERGNDFTTELSDEELDKLHFYFKTEEGRNFFASTLSQHRGSCSLSKSAFEILWRLLKIALIQSDIYNDYGTAKQLMHMAATYYHSVDGVHDYVQSRLKSIELWKKPRYWDYAFYDSVSCERAKTGYKKEWKSMKPEEQEEFHSRERSIFFGQLGSFAMLMLSFGVLREAVREFVLKQCLINGLTEEQSNALLLNLDSLANSVLFQEEESMKINKLKETEQQDQESSYQKSGDLQSTIKDEILREEYEKLKRRQSAFQRKYDALLSVIKMHDDMKEWIQTHHLQQKLHMKQQIQELRLLLDAKEKEIEADLEQKNKETLQTLSTRNSILRQMQLQTELTLSAFSELLQLEDPKLLLERAHELEKTVDEQMDFSTELLSKPNQILSHDYNYSLRIISQRNALEELGTHEKLSIARWKIANFSSLVGVTRESSSKIRLHGFNWRFYVYPSGTQDSQDHLGLYLEFVDAVNAVGWSLNVKWTMRLINQLDYSKIHQKGALSHNFCAATPKGGCPTFISNKELKDLSTGWLVDDSVLFELEIFEVEVVNVPH